jgi:hypothetical protein
MPTEHRAIFRGAREKHPIEEEPIAYNKVCNLKEGIEKPLGLRQNEWCQDIHKRKETQ